MKIRKWLFVVFALFLMGMPYFISCGDDDDDDYSDFDDDDDGEADDDDNNEPQTKCEEVAQRLLYSCDTSLYDTDRDLLDLDGLVDYCEHCSKALGISGLSPYWRCLEDHLSSCTSYEDFTPCWHPETPNDGTCKDIVAPLWTCNIWFYYHDQPQYYTPYLDLMAVCEDHLEFWNCVDACVESSLCPDDNDDALDCFDSCEGSEL